MRLHTLQMSHKDYYNHNSPLVVKAEVETNSGLKFTIDFTAEMSAELAQAAAEIVGKMVRAAGPHLHKERMDDPTPLLEMKGDEK